MVLGLDHPRVGGGQLHRQALGQRHEVVVEEVGHHEQVAQLGQQNNVSGYAATGPVAELLEAAHPEDQLEHAGKAQCKDGVTD